MRKLLTAAMSSVILTGCATPEWYQKTLNTYIGQPVPRIYGQTERLIDGKPYKFNERYYPGHYGTDYNTSHCIVWFVTKKGIITDMYATGNMPWCSDKYAAQRKKPGAQ